MKLEADKTTILEHLAAFGHALGNVNRIRIINSLCHSDKNVERLAEGIGESMAATSAHLKVLKESGLVKGDKRGRHVVYRLASAGVSDLWVAFKELGEQLLPEVRELTRRQFDDRGHLSPLTEEALSAQLHRKRDLLIDLRPGDEYIAAHLPGAVHLPYEELDTRMSSLPKKRRLLVYCRGQHCLRAIDGVERLRKKNYNAERLRFSVPEWRKAGLPLSD